MIRLALGRRAFGRLPWPAGILAAIVIVCACAGPGREKPAPPSGGAPRAPGAAQGGAAVNLPMQAGVWTRADAPKRIDARTIFDYMDGGGELYVGYRFDHLDVYEYSSRDQGSILVELYWMTSRDEALDCCRTIGEASRSSWTRGRPARRFRRCRPVARSSAAASSGSGRTTCTRASSLRAIRLPRASR